MGSKIKAEERLEKFGEKCSELVNTAEIRLRIIAEMEKKKIIVYCQNGESYVKEKTLKDSVKIGKEIVNVYGKLIEDISEEIRKLK